MKNPIIVLSVLSVLSVSLCVCESSSAESRTWTSVDGTRLFAEMIDSTATTVTIRRNSDGRRFTIPLSRFSQRDQDWVMAEAGKTRDVLHPVPQEVLLLVNGRGTVLFEDNFDREDSPDTDDLGEHWTTNSKSRAQGAKQNDIVDGELVMTLSDKADHAISTVHNTSVPFADAVTYVRMKLEEGEQLKLAFNDREFKPVHAGHVNGVTINPTKITLADEREGRFGPMVYPMKDDPEQKETVAEIIAATEKTFKLDLKTGEWHDVVTVHDGTVLTAYIDGKKVASFDSIGFSHLTKRQFAFAVPKRATVDNLKIWSLKPVD